MVTRIGDSDWRLREWAGCTHCPPYTRAAAAAAAAAAAVGVGDESEPGPGIGGVMY